MQNDPCRSQPTAKPAILPQFGPAISLGMAPPLSAVRSPAARPARLWKQFLLGLSLLVALGSQSFAQWTQTSGPGGGLTTAIHARGTTLLCGNFEHFTLTNTDPNAGTLYRSVDHGLTWTVSNTGFTGVPDAFTDNDTSVFVATETDGIFRSMDDGVTWSALANTNQLSPFKLLYANGVLYVGSSTKGVYHSLDNGNTFLPYASGLPDVPGITSMAHVGDTVFVGVSTLFPRPQGVYRSTDEGMNWVQVNNGMGANPSINDLVVKGTTIFAAKAGLFDGAIYKSTDLGATWTISNNGNPDQPRVLHAAGDGSLYLSAFNGFGTSSIYRSTNDGASWTLTGPGIPSTEATVAFASIGGEVYTGLANYGSVYKTLDAGASWQSSNIGLPEVDVNAIFPSGSYLFSGSLSVPGIHRSADGGNTWLPFGQGLDSSTVKSVTAFAQNTSYLFASVDGKGPYRSSDNGANWQLVSNGLTTFGVYGHGFATNGTDVYLATEDGVFRTTNSGGNWTIASPVVNNSRPQVDSIAVLSGSVYAGTSVNGIFKSSDNGATWTFSSKGIPGAAPILSLVVRGTDLIAGTGSGVYLSSDNGANWSSRSSGLAAGQARTVAALGDTWVTAIYDITNGGSQGLFITTNSGVSWSAFSGGIGFNAVRALAISGSTIFAGTETQSIWTAPLQVTVGNTLSVLSQSVTRSVRGTRTTATDTVVVKDQNGQLVSGVTVSATYSGPSAGSISGITDTSGLVKLKTRAARNPVGTWCFTVTNLTKSGYTYDPSANVVTTQCEN